jgi:hypothetical protein
VRCSGMVLCFTGGIEQMSDLFVMHRQGTRNARTRQLSMRRAAALGLPHGSNADASGIRAFRERRA